MLDVDCQELGQFDLAWGLEGDMYIRAGFASIFEGRGEGEGEGEGALSSRVSTFFSFLSHFLFSFFSLFPSSFLFFPSS